MIFIDTGAFFARHFQRDQYHDASTQKWQKIQAASEQCFTSDFVLSETATLLARKADYRFSASRVRSLYESSALSILRTERDDKLLALDWMEKYADQQVSFTDCISFVLMEKQGIKRVFTFDRHFTLAGFEVES